MAASPDSNDNNLRSVDAGPDKSESDHAESAVTEQVRPAEIVGSLDTDTKIRLVSGKSFWHLQPLPDFGLTEIMVTDGPHGLRRQETTADHLGMNAARSATCFPTAAALGSTWDIDLIEEVGSALGVEALDQGVSVVLGPGLNLKRHPAGGRCFEYFSEDPHLSGKLAAAMVRGIQSQGVGTSIKHYAANNHESHRLVVDAIIDERTLREMYLRGFEIAVRESQPWTVMCAYNKVNGTYASEHHELLTAILRDEWGFEGLVMTDWGAANDRVAGIKAGLDLEMPGSNGAFTQEILDALDDGALSADELDRCAERVVHLIQRGQQHARVDSNSDVSHHALTRRAGAAGTVLLRNTGVLPLSAKGRIAVIGEFAETPRYQGAGSSQVTPKRLDNALTALRERVGADATVTYSPGYDAATGETTLDLIESAARAATDADVAVVFAGLPGSYESEGFDRPSLDMPAGHVQLIETVAASGTPVVVVLANGGAVHMPWAERVAGILECWLGGQASGSSAVDVLFGDSEPGGRLAESIPHHVAQLPSDRNFPGLPRQVQYREGLYVGYRFHDTAGVPAHFAFGSGLSYTTFDWTKPSVAKPKVSRLRKTASGSTGSSKATETAGSDEGAPIDIEVKVRVTNTGDRAGSDVVQVYIRRSDSVVYRPRQELKAFTKVHLAPGESSDVSIHLDRSAFTTWDTVSHSWVVEAGSYDVAIARSSVDEVHVQSISIDSDDAVATSVGPRGFVADDAEFVTMLGHPIPAVDPDRPFTRNSTLADIEATKMGRIISDRVIREGLKRAEHEFPDPDEATIKMFKSALREGPARGLVLMGGGVIGFDALDRIIEGLNGEWRELGKNLFETAKSAIKKDG
ncbi:MAG: glycoside hydrolase family 3 C-terminal domain-containing protein [Microthrixaceae bacterium]